MKCGVTVLSIYLAPALVMAQFQPVVPATGARPDGPYSPGLWAQDYFYVSGMGPRDAGGRIAPGFEAQARQVMENVKRTVEAAGLTMEHLVYTHVYLRDMANYDALNQIYRGYFSKPPARAVLGIAGLRDDALIDMKAVAVRHLYQKQLIQIPGFQPKDPYT